MAFQEPGDGLVIQTGAQDAFKAGARGGRTFSIDPVMVTEQADVTSAGREGTPMLAEVLPLLCLHGLSSGDFLVERPEAVAA